MSMQTGASQDQEDENEEQKDATSPTVDIDSKDEDKIPRNPEPMASLQQGQSESILSLPYRSKEPSPPSPPPGKENDDKNERRPILVLEPPVTKAGLRELNVQHFVMDENLRNSINFDPNLHFRPNRDGLRGLQKQQLENAFWDNLRYEIKEYIANQRIFELEHGVNWSLPNILRTIEEILETLVPPESRATVAEVLDVELLMQQFSRGAINLEKLASWLSSILTSHCAPMRDEWVVKMVGDFVAGDRTGDVFKIVDGLKELLGVLEAMKLDVANHQIRCIKDTLRNDTVEFMQALFRKRMTLVPGERDYVDVKAAYQWYQAAKTIPREQPAAFQRKADMYAFFSGMVDMLFPSSQIMGDKHPDTFTLDRERIVKLRMDLLDAVNLEICLRLYRQLYSTAVNNCSPARALSTPGQTNHYSSIRHNQHTQQHQHQRQQPPNSQRASSPVFTTFTPPSRGSSPRSGTPSTPSRPHTHFSSPQTHTLTPTLTEESHLATHLLSILADMHTPCRWSAATTYLTSEILRFTQVSPAQFRVFENYLAYNLGKAQSKGFQKAEEAVKARLLGLVAGLVVEWDGLSCSELSEVATSGRGEGGREGGRLLSGRRIGGAPGMVGPGGERRHIMEQSHWEEPDTEAGLQGMARLVAHMGILHWRIWGSLVYLRNPDAEDHMPLEGGKAESGDVEEVG